MEERKTSHVHKRCFFFSRKRLSDAAVNNKRGGSGGGGERPVPGETKQSQACFSECEQKANREDGAGCGGRVKHSSGLARDIYKAHHTTRRWRMSFPDGPSPAHLFITKTKSCFRVLLRNVAASRLFGVCLLCVVEIFDGEV